MIPTLLSTAFLDYDVGDIQAFSQWQVTDTPGDYSNPIFDSGVDGLHLVSITIPSNTLNYTTTYYGRVRHHDNNDAWSNYSDETSFTTQDAVAFSD